MWNQTKKNLENAAEKMKRQHDKHVKPSRHYKPGDQVYLDAVNVSTGNRGSAVFHTAQRTYLQPPISVEYILHIGSLVVQLLSLSIVCQIIFTIVLHIITKQSF